ncbi:antileukoproteinase [Vicugna pacos]|uniref:Antileukoproteinase n=1 Tax=Vicugna pacos TaxID=30538 RepID=A0A6I9I6D5_VICPA|nr:antileukoproteinase [Vicugna pacos]
MKSSSLFPFVLLALGTLAPWAVESAEKALKAGACPLRNPAQCLRVTKYEKPRCRSDWQCPGKKKCCLDTCELKCLDPVDILNPVKKKSGKCPVVQGQCLILNPPNHCETDGQCLDNLKCCRSTCGKVCVSPVRA